MWIAGVVSSLEVLWVHSHMLGLLGVEHEECQAWVERGWDGLGSVEGNHVLGLQGERHDELIAKPCG